MSKDHLHHNQLTRLSALLKPIYAVAQCLRFYSRLPIPPLAGETNPFGAPSFNVIACALPFAGLIIGLGGAGPLLFALWLSLGPTVSATLAIATMTLITGAFHEDGLADTADGFGGGATVERRLAIMRDSLIGSFGASALILGFFLRITALAGIASLSWTFAASALVISSFLSRISALLLLIMVPPARSDGISTSLGKASWSQYVAGLVTAWIMAGLIALTAHVSLITLCLVLTTPIMIAYVIAYFSKKMIGGQTGDVAGAAQQCGEIAIYLSILGALG